MKIVLLTVSTPLFFSIVTESRKILAVTIHNYLLQSVHLNFKKPKKSYIKKLATVTQHHLISNISFFLNVSVRNNLLHPELKAAVSVRFISTKINLRFFVCITKFAKTDILLKPLNFYKPDEKMF